MAYDRWTILTVTIRVRVQATNYASFTLHVKSMNHRIGRR
jgi:hypothetical protein